MTTWHCERRSQESGKENVLEVRESLQVSKLTEMLTCFGKDDDVPNRSFDFLLSACCCVFVVVSLLGLFWFVFWCAFVVFVPCVRFPCFGFVLFSCFCVYILFWF